MKLFITRLYQIPILQPLQTIGVFDCVNDDNEIVYSGYTLELPWLNNKQRISCIPARTYKAVKRYSKKYGWHYHIKNVDGRTLILIHGGNIYTHTLGCILVGKKLDDINGDDLDDTIKSKKAMNKLLQIMGDEFKIEIKWRT